MSTRFDSMASRLFDKVGNQYGTPLATWAPAGGGLEQSATVLFNNPSQTAKLLNMEYDPLRYMAEYKLGTFVGLYELINDGLTETMTIDGVDYQISAVEALFDGKTYQAIMRPL